ncbi:ead/Ea22-like family protein [Enterobacter hormaechei]|uniref:ead/Ea22-like family protein n=1 Tax=Enterobacter hormaechei TaxID=158836 RepID=UPI000A4052EC|nr:ead/Ea22-like family protein [Enterobacter hormaechei]EKU5355695.1 ead/Ea22-like family protein [Enterobacter hormaechei]ELH1422745.1 ead/Ea22-like family protein [Enterobacter hormaechei]MBJ6536504.1 ead/Ea22-like family protein [Enterobacter hormaechei]MCM7446592.1 ead/Ea22-like family protein [Enterobacter hormaechei]QEQ45374.1 ead/Ea22-like family protein [Enterobacter hormaechei]
MSNIDKRALREAAVRAGGVKWQYMRATQHTKAYLTDEKGWTVVNCTDGDVPAKCAGFIESANPATVLALLDELEAADKRIAELERNEIREEGNQFLVVRHPGKLPVVKHCAGELEGFLRQLLEHDPMATIDIVTHRYYGVGGQWVQDADEYLQMMAAAAGKGEAS